MTRKDAIKLAQECISREMTRIYPTVFAAKDLRGVDKRYANAEEKYRQLAEASKILDEMTAEQGRLW